MESLQTLVRNLAIILLLGSFLEMMLPSKSMQGFVKLVMGLFVISAILSPISSLLRMPLQMSIPAWTETTTNDLPVLASGSDGSKIGRDAVQEQYKEIIKNQVRALTLGVSGVETAEVQVELSESMGEFTEQPQVLQMVIRINPDSQKIQPVKEVIIGEKNEQVQVLSARAVEVREKVAALMQLPQDRIIVEERIN